MVRAVTKLRHTAGEAELLAGGGPGDPVPGSEELRTFGHLLSHKEDFLGNKQKLEAIRLLYDETEEFLQEMMPSFDTFVEILGRLYINGFEICDSQMVTYGWGVYLGPRWGEDGFSNFKYLNWCCKRLIGDVFKITEKAPTRAFSWLKALTSTFHI